MTDTLGTTYVHWLQEQHGQPELYGVLNDAEQRRAASFKFDQHRHLYIVAHVFLRKVLSYHAGIAMQHWQFYQNSHGKPYIENTPFQSIQFNLSHTQGMIVCAINKKYAVGVDVEWPRPLKYMESMSRRHYTAHEYTDLFSRNTADKQLHRFYTYWTLKESLVKALGCGLSMPLKKIGLIQSTTGHWMLENALLFNNRLIGKDCLFNNTILVDHYQVAVTVIAHSEESPHSDFCFIDCNHPDIQHWNNHDKESTC